MAQMEQALGPFMSDKTLGLPYWDWSSSEGTNGPYPAFPDLWKDVQVGIKDPRHWSYDGAFGDDSDDSAGNFAYGSHCRSDRFSATVARITNENELHENLRQLDADFNTFARDLNNAMNIRSVRRFSRELSDIHGKIHVGFACRIHGTEQAAFDPIFYLHHSFAEKVLVDWQKLHPRTPRILSRRRIQRPFDDTRYNKFMEITGITDRQSWDYERNLCYCYDCDLPTVTSTL